QSAAAENVSQLNQRIAEVRTERLRLQSDAAQFVKKSKYSAEELLTFPSIAGAPAVVDLLKKIGEKEALIAPLDARYKHGHPPGNAAQAELDRLRAALATAAFNAAKLLDMHLREVKATEEKLNEALREQQRLMLNEDATGIDYAALTRETDA